MNLAPVLIVVGFHAVILLILVVDLGILHRRAGSVSMKEAAVWSAVWLLLALLFAFGGIRNFWDWWDPEHPHAGPAKSLEFITGYLVEFSLSVDNLFVFLVIFRYFAVPEALRHRVLVFGIVGAVLLRAVFILVGAALLHYFEWILYVFGVFLLWTAYRLARSGDHESDPGNNPILRAARRVLPIVNDHEAPTFFVRRAGRWHATPLALVLLVVETTDIMFALDSIPAIFGITQDPFIVYTSNILAVMGLRSLYFLLANVLGLFRYLNIGLSFVLGFVGVKMLVEKPLEPTLDEWGIEKPQRILISLGTILAILAIAVIASLLAGRETPSPPPSIPEGEAKRDMPPAGDGIESH
jgi:tellurite resistance protein TerC